MGRQMEGDTHHGQQELCSFISRNALHHHVLAYGAKAVTEEGVRGKQGLVGALEEGEEVGEGRF